MPLNPTSTISGNGVAGQVTASYSTGSSSWNIVTQNLPGQVLTGTFPNTFNSSGISSQSYNFTWPYRGGRNYPNKLPRTSIPAGIVGVSSVGLVIQGPRSGITVIGTAGQAFNINAVVANIRGEDLYGGKPDTAGSYHYQDNRFVKNNAWGPVSNWTAGYVHPNGHSKIIGWAKDGYPIYGPYGYTDPLNSTIGISRVESGYQVSLRADRPLGRSLVLNGSVVSSTNFVVYSATGVTPGMDVTGTGISSGTKIISVLGTSIRVNNPITVGSGAILSATYPVGIFTEDFIYLPTSNSALDLHNGRYCVTPDFPDGTYAYFLTEDNQGNAVYPYIIGNTYYGSTTADSTDSTLSSLTTDQGNLTPTFVSTVTNYSIDVANTVTSIRYIAVKSNANSIARLNTATLASGVPSPAISLPIGLTTSTIIVTSEYFTTSTYRVTVNRLRKAINTLDSLSVAEGLLSPTFESTVTSYAITVNTTVTSLTVSFTKTDVDSTVVVGNTNLSFGINAVTLTVTAQNGSVRVYTINATRLSNVTLLSNLQIDNITVPNFNSGKYLYSVSFPNANTFIGIKATTVDPLASIFIKGIEYASGDLISPVTLNPGLNPIGIEVVSSDLTEKQFYRIDAFRQLSSIANLSGLSLFAGNFPVSLTPVFNSTITSYSGSIPNNITEVKVLPTIQENTGQLTINGLPALSGTLTQVTNLAVGTNTIAINVISPNQLVTKLYNVNISRAASNVSTLTNLFAYNVSLDPKFTPGIFTYTETVGYDTEFTKIVASASHPSASIQVNGVSVLQGQESQNIPLSVGTNTVTVIVTAENGISQSTYRLNLNRRKNYNSQLIDLGLDVASLNPEFSRNVFDYSAEVAFGVVEAEISAYTSDVNAYAVIVSDGTNTVTTSSGGMINVDLKGSISNSQWLGTTTIAITVVAEDQENTSTYNLSITRRPSSDARLQSIVTTVGPLTPAFNPSTFDYYIPVAFSTSTVGIKVNPMYELAKAFYRGNVLSTSTFENFSLYVGVNPIPIQCVAADGLGNLTYNIVFERAAPGLSTVSLLRELELSKGTLSTPFKPEIFNYFVDLPYEVQSIKVKPVKVETGASITVNGKTVISGEFSDSIEIPAGVSAIVVAVTAADNASISNYTISVNRIGSTDSKLSNIYTSYGQLDRVFDKDITQYSVKVKNSISSISVKPIVNDSQSEVYVDGLFVPAGGWSQPKNINVGENIVTVIVTAGDKFTKTIYQIKFIRDSFTVIDPKELFLIDGTGNISANYVDNNLLRIFTKANTTYVNVGSFATSPSLQNLEVIYPYRGGLNESALSKPLRSQTGMIGVTFVGIPLFGPSSGITVQGENNNTWTLDAVKTQLPESDIYGGYVTNTGLYNYRSNQFTKTNAWKNINQWFGSMTHPDGHSRIVGFAADGYPIYGPYGYSNPVSSFSSVIPMVSKYSSRNTGPNRPQPITITYTGNALGNTIELTSSTHSLVKVGMAVTGIPGNTLTNYIVTSVSTNSDYITLNNPTGLGPFAYNLSASYPTGSFIEDYYYDESKPATLDRHNGRYCVTPEYPQGTYAYFATGITEPEYPYIIGPSYYGLLSTETPGLKAIPRWTTNAGFITTATENISFSRSLLALGANNYKLISGELPTGLRLNTSTGVVSGIPSLVWQTTESEFVVRAQNQYGVADRPFRIDVRGATPPSIVTFGPRFAIGPSGENYIVNGQFVDFQFTAIADIVPEGKSVFFFIEEGDGILPPGLTLTSSGRLYGQVLDDLSLPYQAGTDGRYDVENYDSAPFEHESQQEFGVRGRYVNKTYRFFLTASNGPASRKVEYIIEVRDPASLVDIGQYPVAPQWLSPSNLGTVISNSTFIYSLETYDCDQGGGNIVYDWIDPNGGNTALIPPGLSLDLNTGVISGKIGYTPIHTTTYSFRVRAYKTNIVTGTTKFRDKTFTLTVLGTIYSGLTFESNSLIGTLYQGEQSELFVKASQKDGESNIIYSLQSGSLPPGLSLASDGAVQGKVNYNSTQTNVMTYSCVIKATNAAFTSILGNFQIRVNPYEGKKFTKISLKPLMSLETRSLFENFISNQNIFDSTIMYRPLDTAFSIRKSVEFILEHAIEEKYVADYVNNMQDYFSRKKLQFGDIKSAFALDENYNKLYEVVYVELIDNLVNPTTGESVSATVTINNEIIYPNSIDNMRSAFESQIETNNYFLPKFMKTVQDSSGIALGRILCMPLCYCLPGKSKSLINKINASGFDFKAIHFDVDRLVVESTLDNSTTKYLLFPKREV